MSEYLTITLHLGAAWLAGSLIGLERSFHGRPAGFRTHALVCLASALLMIVTVHQWQWLGPVPLETVRTDPTRMAQGIMTGIGFLGAGVIFKDGLSVRGLTTAASIWITAALGILFGIGFFYTASVASIATIGTLAVFRSIENAIPSYLFAHLMVRFEAGNLMSEPEVRSLLKQNGFSLANMSYRLDRTEAFFEYKMVIRALNKRAFDKLATTLQAESRLIEFRISPTGD